MKRSKSVFIFLLVLIVSAAAAFFAVPKEIGDKYLKFPSGLSFYDALPWRLGLDLVGGSALVYEIDLSGVDVADYGDVVSGLRDVVEKRINQFGVAEPKVIIAKKGEDKYQLVVELAGVKDLGDAVKQIGETPSLDFRTVKQVGDKTEFVPTGITGRYIKNATVSFDNLNRPVFNFELDATGAALFEKVTTENVGKPLCIFVDNNFIFPDNPGGSCPRINEKIAGGKAQISGGDITLASANQLVGRFQAGALSAPITLVNQRTVNVTSAGNSLNKIIVAGTVGTGLVMVLMILNYGFHGFVASFALVIYTILTLALFKLIPGFTMSLAGIAGFILSIGMAVDANILIFERIREEKKRGLQRASAIEEGFRRAWTSIRDSNISTILTSLILYYFTTGFVRGFALTLGLGVLVSMFSAISVTRVILRTFVKNKSNQ